MEHSRLTGDFDESSLEFQRKILERSGLGDNTYVPEAMHFLPPRPSYAGGQGGGRAGGRAVIDELEKNLQLMPVHVEASRMTLHRFGNTSSSSIWYELAYIEAKGRMHRGHKVWQIAFGSDFKCNTAVWEAIRNVKPSRNSPWADCIDKYPVEVVS